MLAALRLVRGAVGLRAIRGKHHPLLCLVTYSHAVNVSVRSGKPHGTSCSYSARRHLSNLPEITKCAGSVVERLFAEHYPTAYCIA